MEPYHFVVWAKPTDTVAGKIVASGILIAACEQAARLEAYDQARTIDKDTPTRDLEVRVKPF